MVSRAFYVLDGHTPIEVTDVLEWARMFETAARHVARTTLAEGVEVSTAFLGIDHSFGTGPPLLFETLVFGGKCDGDMRRYATWEEAERGHEEECVRVLRGIRGLEETDGEANRTEGVQS